MTRAQLEHAIRAAADVANDPEIVVFGSQAILGQFPDAPPSLLTSTEVDAVPRNRPEQVELIDGALGELSAFHHTHGFYVHGVPLDTAALPPGWKQRTVTVRNSNTRDATGFCVEAHDLAASKLAAFRDKDREFVRVLLVEKMVDPATLIDRVQHLPIGQAAMTRVVDWLRRTLTEIGLTFP